jgi:hypothetical protein
MKKIENGNMLLEEIDLGRVVRILFSIGSKDPEYGPIGRRNRVLE